MIMTRDKIQAHHYRIADGIVMLLSINVSLFHTEYINREDVVMMLLQHTHRYTIYIFLSLVWLSLKMKEIDIERMK